MDEYLGRGLGASGEQIVNDCILTEEDRPVERRPMEAHIAATYQMRRLGKMPIDFLDIA